MLKIRLQRTGKKKQSYFRIVLQEQTQKPKGKFLESFGYFNPHQNIIEANGERINYWLIKGAKPSETVHNLLITKGIIQGEKIQVTKPKKKEKSPEQAPSHQATAPVPLTPETPPVQTPTEKSPKEESQN